MEAKVLGIAVITGGLLWYLLRRPADGGDGGDGTAGVNFTSTPSGASVYVGGNLVGVTPFSRSFAYGIYRVVFKLAGYQDYATSFETSELYDSTNVGAVMTPVAPSQASLTLSLTSASRYWAYGYFPQVSGVVSNNSAQPITGREVLLVRRYISPQSGNELINSHSLATALRVGGVPQSAEYPSFNLAPGESIGIDFIGQLDVPAEVTIQVWLMDAVTGATSNVLSIPPV